jgi:tetratricopeptide (TPR) repeat protein
MGRPVRSLETARAYFAEGAYGKARAAALEGLGAAPDDAELLRLAGRAGVELNADDALELLRRVAELRPDEPQSWHDLGDALATDGRSEEATDAFRRAVELDPHDELALTHLGHTAFTSGNRDDAVSYLSQAANRTEGSSSAAISLVEVYRSVGEHELALAAAEKIATAAPDDVMAVLDVAELSMTVGRLDDAVAAFERLRDIEEIADHQVYAIHGMIQVELRRAGWDRALELAREALALDPYGSTKEILAFLETRQSGAPSPSLEEVEKALSMQLAEHRRLHGEDPRLEGDSGIG